MLALSVIVFMPFKDAIITKNCFKIYVIISYISHILCPSVNKFRVVTL